MYISIEWANFDDQYSNGKLVIYSIKFYTIDQTETYLLVRNNIKEEDKKNLVLLSLVGTKQKE